MIDNPNVSYALLPLDESTAISGPVARATFRGNSELYSGIANS